MARSRYGDLGSRDGHPGSDGWRVPPPDQDVSEDIAREIQHRFNLQLTDVPSHLQEFVDRYAAQDLRQFSLRLV
ncbi:MULTISPECIES: hypothetical protein [unclassified Bradyrhizobium]|uniref:hypothetical protein n=1 Tax=unclassified Bradyrhizobium TaxID=2631580 RepID=UPI001FFA96E5|nr:MULTISPECIES: hypothetical protein [unclassified Bradyrhizobium]